ncbi:unnamed protein product [Microthlaspi erraticum]|uniref:Uncharacterized protein n=1 Tax=Microthlaspi erraticum TaxID=1685480 RepID=A0A6D2JH71_9BRAS|nr:unnamed protein product [Microthlaspi erraticum]
MSPVVSDYDLFQAAAEFKKENTKRIADHLKIPESEVQRRLHFLINDLERPVKGEKSEKGKRKWSEKEEKEKEEKGKKIRLGPRKRLQLDD